MSEGNTWFSALSCWLSMSAVMQQDGETVAMVNTVTGSTFFFSSLGSGGGF